MMLHVARVTIEFTAPMIIGGGDAAEEADDVFVVDGNGLPTIPGTSIAGVLRHALPERRANALFGFQGREDGQASAVNVSFALPHNAKDSPVPWLASRFDADVVTRALQAGVVRDHVRLDARGVAAPRGKFDEKLVPTGARFTFELSLRGDAGRAADLDELLALLNGGALRLGGRSRRGFGTFRLVRVARGVVQEGSAAHAALPASVERSLDAKVFPLAQLDHIGNREPEGMLVWSVTLAAQDYWLFGGGNANRPQHRSTRQTVAPKAGDPEPKFRDGGPATAFEKAMDIVPFTEPRVRWTPQGIGTVEAAELAPHLMVVSGLKGALRHRTCFWARTALHQFAAEPWVPASDVEPDDVRALFGVAMGDEGVGGRVFIPETVVDAVQYGRLDHVALDRFTQGPIDGALFSEAPLYGGLVSFEVHIDTRGWEAGQRDAALRALGRALKDLVEGRLSLGAGASRGHGRFGGGINMNQKDAR